MPNTTATVYQPQERAANQDASIAVSMISNSLLLCEGLVMLLQAYIKLNLIGSYRSDSDITASLPNPPGHVILLDSGIGQQMTITRIHQCRVLPSPPYILVLELTNNIEIILACIEAGASGYTLQGSSIVEVAHSIKQVHQGMTQCSPEVTARLFTRLAELRVSQSSRRNVSLSPRELEVLDCITKGYSNKEIAAELVIEVRTVKHHVHNILDKLKQKHRWDAARFALEQGWFDPGKAQDRP